LNAYALLFKDVLTRLSWRFPLLVAWTVAVGVTEGASVVLLLPALNRIGVTIAGNVGVVAWVNASLAYIGADSAGEILAVVVAVATIQMVLALTLNYWTVLIARRYQSERQLALFGAFMRARWLFLADRKAGDLVNAIITECERLGRAFTLSLSLVGSAIIALIFVLISALMAWQAAAGIIGLAVIAALGTLHLYGKSYAAGARLAPLNAQLQSFLDERIGGIKLIKAIAAIERADEEIEPLVRNLEDANIVATVMPGAVRGILEYVGLIGVAIILILGTVGLGMAPANVVAVLALFGRLFPRITAVQSQLHSLNNNVHAIGVIGALQSAAEAEAERQDVPGAPRSLPVALPAELAVRGLTVKFGERKALDGVDLHLTLPGFVAIVGGSGAGKSTLVHTLLGLTEADAGSIRLGGYDLGSAPLSAWRRAIGYVPQETILFHASVRDNLTFANPDASWAEIEAAARRAHAHDFIMAMPGGYDTVIGDQGVKLSGGQRQRLGIARALLTNPVLLVLDEAMSALDADSEAEILRTLEELRGQIGILLIAHRLGTVAAADSIYVFEAGRIVESGTWVALMTRCGRLYALAGAQGLDRVAANGR
jgi:ABC-type multidrug transport system fused ATPase/permease subunit